LPGYGRCVHRLASQAEAAAQRWHGLTSAEWTADFTALRQRLRLGLPTEATVIEVLGAAGAQLRRTLGLQLHLVQYFATLVQLDGRLAEMATGEGKTVVAALAAAIQSLAGSPVHVITANEYLVQRDSKTLQPFFSALGLDVAHISPAMSAEMRRRSYGADVVYCTAKELVFDYLRDGLILKRGRTELHRRVNALLDETDAGPQPVMRGLCAAILDEADSVLIDEATVPLIISSPQSKADRRAFLWQALAVARLLNPRSDFEVSPGEQQVELSNSGRQRLLELSRSLPGGWQRARHATEVVTTALIALYALKRDFAYVVRDAAICPLDQVTGRIAEGRVWSRGLQTLLELKEGCAVTPETETIARTSFPRFFRRYPQLSGMSGSLRESATELRQVYGLHIVTVPLRKPSRRRELRTRVFRTDEARWDAVSARAREMLAIDRPVLVGTDSIEDSEALAAHLREAGIACEVLNARQDANEAALIARAGHHGQVTVATRMAGRGTDIRLAEGVADKGGLHVINCQANPSRRLDRQLAGRCGRQGDPGSTELCYRCEPSLGPLASVRAHSPQGWGKSGWWTSLRARWLLQREDIRQRQLRAQLLQLEREWADKLSFSDLRD